MTLASVVLAVLFPFPLQSQTKPEDVDKVHVRIAKQVAPATVALDGGGVRGSGVIIDKSGIILTSPTAVGSSSNRVTVVTRGARVYSGKVLGRANDRELVVVKIDAGHELPYVELGDSDAVRPGQVAYVFGDSFDSIRSDDQAAMSLGVISGVYELNQRHEKSLYTGKVLETSAAVNPSQNGGPLVDREGRLLGLITLNYDDSKFTGLAVPINLLKPLVEKIRKEYSSAPVVIAPLRPLPSAAPESNPPVREAGEPWLGVEVKAAGDGVEITRVSHRSPAFTAGLRRGDILIRIDTTPVASADALQKALGGKVPGDNVRVTLTREGAGIQELTVRLIAKPVY